MQIDIVKILIPTLLSFLIGILSTSQVTRILYKNKLWKQKKREENKVEMSEAFKKIHNAEDEIRTPRAGGSIIWISVLGATFFLFVLSRIVPGEIVDKLEFVSRNQTWLLLAGMMIGAVVGLFDDIVNCLPSRKTMLHGMPRGVFTATVFGIALSFALWFFFKLDYSGIHVPFYGQLELGLFFIPFFIVTMLGVFSSGVIDGIDGLAGGVFAVIFSAFGCIALIQNQIDIATFCFATTSGILAFLWFNIPPARFYMGETGMLALTIPLTVVAFLTDQALLLLVIGFPLVATSLSSFLQIFSKKLLGKKILPITPLHHYFQYVGWPNAQVVMRYWVFSVMVAVLGIIIALVG